MGFTFRYEALLSYREHIKEQAEIELARVRRRVREARDALDLYRQSLAKTNTSFESRLKTRISSGEIENHRDYLTGMGAKIKAQEREIRKQEEIEKGKLEDLLTKTKQYKMIEKLKEKDYKKWQQKQLREEQNRMNEVAVTRHGRMSL